MEDFGLKLIKVTDRIYYMPDLARYDWPHLGLVIGDKHTMMLDGGASKRHVEIFFAKLEENGLPKPDLCALTHRHWDHTYGLAFTGTISFANSETDDIIRQMQTWGWSDREMRHRIETGEDLEFSYPHLNDEYPDKSAITIVPADVRYENRLEVDLGGVSVVMKKAENSHSSDCSILYVTGEKCLFLGDILYEDLFPATPAYYKDKHRRLTRALAEFEADYAICGHHPMMNGKELTEYISRAAEKAI